MAKLDLAKRIGILILYLIFIFFFFFSIIGNNIDPGILPRFCQDLFDKIASDLEQQNVIVEVLFYELYLEKVLFFSSFFFLSLLYLITVLGL